jgi:hypothetical protein
MALSVPIVCGFGLIMYVIEVVAMGRFLHRTL